MNALLQRCSIEHLGHLETAGHSYLLHAHRFFSARISIQIEFILLFFWQFPTAHFLCLSFSIDRNKAEEKSAVQSIHRCECVLESNHSRKSSGKYHHTQVCRLSTLDLFRCNNYSSIIE